jgi:hypothetical protein
MVESALDVPNSFLCPITLEIMEDPVATSDGFSYERTAIEYWLRRGHRTSPMTGLPLEHEELIENITLRKVIEKEMARIKIEQENLQRTDVTNNSERRR